MYVELLLKGFAVERQIEIYVPVRYGSQTQVSEERLNINLIDYYFDDQIPSLFTCLFNKNPTEFTKAPKDVQTRLNRRLDACVSLLTPIAIERLVLLDKYYQAKPTDSIVKECQTLTKSLCDRAFNPERVNANEVIFIKQSYA